MADISDYTGLIPSANSSRERFIASITAALQPFVDTRKAMQSFPVDYDLDKAIGAQLDVVGEWVGLSRKLAVPITGVYFAFDTEGVGFDEGVWFSTGDPTDGITSLDDGTYRELLRLKIVANTWNGSFEDVQILLATLSSDGTNIFAVDNMDMSMTIGVSGIVPSLLFSSLLRTVCGWLRPAAVNFAQIAVTSTNGTPIFGFDIQNEYIAGFDTGSWPVNY